MAVKTIWRSNRAKAAGIAGVALSLGVLCVPAGAASPTANPAPTAGAVSEVTEWPAELGPAPDEWGGVTLQPDDEDASPVLETRNVGGGTWNFGTVRDGALKKCYSQYIHGEQEHHATVVMDDVTDRDQKGPKEWAKAAVKGGWARGCSFYWGKD
ncbi:lactococcin 972 family bacteriocin [Kitasatospora sp. NPDC056076]|uniref:lactococcin 972 family bacteriocin n=1 Tax=Kitasatospora sp. NPDC056076 TaxID=3345703 RepID=UPI0035D869A4